MQNSEALKKEILGNCSLTERQWEECLCSFTYRKLRAGELLLNQGDVAHFVAYVQSGVLVYYRSMETGDDYTTDFGFSGDWVCDMYSRLNSRPASINIKALEDSDVFILYQSELEKLLVRFPALEKMIRILTERAFLKLLHQSLHLQIIDAKERYLKLLEENPGILQKVPLYHIANYLGIAPKSLSRIRKEIAGE
ncbi:Crp/Fnr family transcriptional regulator [Filimonas effusa]|uniref:Crp/Fnr family transcriptional regulator n=1 Tax=Filimonas effusa TaxID=2508721 RepID=A0A4Q1CZH0_9BACT|nr:Crp/Fnr family transcriptional regulator [Filimonas effusa]RXK80808.1 Crp/Fnr family transcriptional regulator [Filimonas effusa]